jgi:hypothetical protein
MSTINDIINHVELMTHHTTPSSVTKAFILDRSSVYVVKAYGTT